MEILIWIGIGVVAGFVVMAGFFIRRELIVRRGGTIELSIRLSTLVDGRGWAPGYARFSGDELRWYRMFSLALRPRRILPRKGMAVEARRLPEGNERLVLPDGWVVLRCMIPRGRIEIAMPQTTVTGFLSWIEAAPPGAVSPRLAS